MTIGRFIAVIVLLALLPLAIATFGSRFFPSNEGGEDGTVHASRLAYPNLRNMVLVLNDERTGIEVKVDNNGRDLIATGRGGEEIWRVDVIAEIGSVTGSPVIRDIWLPSRGKVGAVIGKGAVAHIDLDSGKVHYLGSN